MDKIVDRVLKELDLDNETVRRELKNVNTAIPRFGHDATSSRYHRLAGLLQTQKLWERSAKSMNEYVTRYGRFLHNDVSKYMLKHSKQLDKLVESLYDYNHRFYYTGSTTLSNSYAMKDAFDKEPSESPVQIYTRVATQIHYKHGMDDIIRCANDQAKGLYSFATPTLTSSGTKKNQTASCFILDVDDSIESIAQSVLSHPAVISSNGGGIGINLSHIRHSEIANRGLSKGVIPLAKILNEIMLYADQRNTRKGAANLCLNCWHIDVEEFIQLTRKTGQVKEGTTDITVDKPFDMFTTVMTNWLFIHRAKTNGDWTLFCPAKVPKLRNKYGLEFIKEYLKYEQDETIPKYAKKTVKASYLANLIFKTRLNTGSPYTVDIDAINFKNPLGDEFYINCPNLCLEVLQFSSPTEIAVCNLASICLPEIVTDDKTVDWDLLGYISRELVTNLNRLIDNSTNSVEQADVGSKTRRSLGIGVQGFADFLFKLDLHFEHERTKDLNKKVAACIYWNTLARSVDLAVLDGPYEGFEHSHAKNGDLQFDLWRKEYETLNKLGYIDPSIRAQEDDDVIDPSSWGQKSIVLSNDEVIEPTWESLKSFIQKYGLRNAHVTCQQPTATTSHINNNCEMKESITQNIYTKETMRGELTIINVHLEKDLREINLWDNDVIRHIIFQQGSVASLPEYFKSKNLTDFQRHRLAYLTVKYKTMYEIKNRTMLQLTADAGRYICQSQSTNLYFNTADINKVKGAFFLASQLGLKTTSYYTRLPSYTVPTFINSNTSPATSPKKTMICTDEVCTACTC